MILNFNAKFPISFPYGALHFAKFVFSITITIIFFFMYFYINGIKVVEVLSYAFSTWSIFSFLSHIIGLQYGLSDSPYIFCYVPFALLDVLFGSIAALTYFSGVIICGTALSLAYDMSSQIFASYLFVFFNCIILTIVHSWYSILLCCKSQSQCIIGIRRIIVEGSTVIYLNLPDIQNIHI